MDANSPEEQAMSATDTHVAGWNSRALDETLSNATRDAPSRSPTPAS
ncbi:hypothetical protein [Streptomyces sp. DH37]|nr:hypothetical protein [Streptomyces sp. DH37]